MIGGTVLLCCLLSVPTDAISTERSTKGSHADDVVDEIFAGYKAFTRPVTSRRAATVVNVSFILMSIIHINEKQQTLSQAFYLDLTWFDHRLAWSGSQHGDLDHLIVPQEKVWLPDVVITPFVGSMRGLGYDALPLRLESSGLILWQPSSAFTTHCDIDITYYPFDKQVCTLRLDAWTSRKDDLVLQKSQSHAVSRESYAENSEWQLLSAVAEDQEVVDSQGTLSAVSVRYVLRRRPVFSTLTVVVPVVLLAFMSTLVFALPAQSGQYTRAVCPPSSLPCPVSTLGLSVHPPLCPVWSVWSVH